MAEPITTTLDVLVVDDNGGDRALVRDLLPHSYRVREAATAREARSHFAERHPDLILLDHRLPDADGTELLPVFVPHHIPVVMLTGIEAPEIIVEAMQQGAQDYLVKGALTREGLGRAVANAIEKAALRRTLEEQQRALAQQAARLEQQARTLEAKNREIRALASALTLAEQAERRRIAELLHDHLQQLLFGTKLSLQFLRTAGPEDFETRLDDADRVLDEALKMTRDLAVDLTPPVLDREELGVGLRWLAEHMGEMYGLTVDVTVDDHCRIPTRELRVLLLQLVRELLFNVVKHACIDRAHVILDETDGHYVLTVEDKGCGFDPSLTEGRGDGASGGFGLYSVRERLELLGGRLEVDAAPGKGTRATIYAPVEEGNSWEVEE